jgi:hypothetical protein
MESVGEAGSTQLSPAAVGTQYVTGEMNDLIAALGIPNETTPFHISSSSTNNAAALSKADEKMTESVYDIVPNPNAENVDLSDLRGVGENKKYYKKPNSDNDVVGNEDDTLHHASCSDTDLENLAELVPDIKTRTQQQLHHQRALLSSSGMMGMISSDHHVANSTKVVMLDGEQQVEVVDSATGVGGASDLHRNHISPKSKTTMASLDDMRHLSSPSKKGNGVLNHTESMVVNESVDYTSRKKQELDIGLGYKNRVLASPRSYADNSNSYDDGYPDSDHALEENAGVHADSKIPSEFMNIGSSANSISTATQTHEVRMPMYLPTFKPATGCTNASDFIVRCFVARLRSGITVVKHGRSRWCKSRLRVLHVHPDGRSLSWKPAEGEPSSSKRPPKLDLSTCLEVRHAWSPDPQNPMYTGTPILRQKCEAANAHKSFALIFKQRTVDITAVTADQCKVLMEGFSALCFRLQVANIAGRNGAGVNKKGQQLTHARPMPEEDGVSTTASATLTNTSATKVR